MRERGRRRVVRRMACVSVRVLVRVYMQVASGRIGMTRTEVVVMLVMLVMLQAMERITLHSILRLAHPYAHPRAGVLLVDTIHTHTQHTHMMLW